MYPQPGSPEERKSTSDLIVLPMNCITAIATNQNQDDDTFDREYLEKRDDEHVF